jgi:hypothetical protein
VTGGSRCCARVVGLVLIRLPAGREVTKSRVSRSVMESHTTAGNSPVGESARPSLCDMVANAERSWEP